MLEVTEGIDQLMAWSREAFSQGNYEWAWKTAQSVTAADKDNAEAHLILCRSLLRLDETDKALVAYRTLQDIASDHPEVQELGTHFESEEMPAALRARLMWREG